MLPMPKYKNHMHVDLACSRERHESSISNLVFLLITSSLTSSSLNIIYIKRMSWVNFDFPIVIELRYDLSA